MSPRDGSRVFFAVAIISASTEIASLPVSPIELPECNGSPETGTFGGFCRNRPRDYTKVTHVNDACSRKSAGQPMESFTFKGANNDDVQGSHHQTARLRSGEKISAKVLDPRWATGAWGNSWSYRWNPELFAANGYVVVMINFHGSTGYGEKFTDSISGDWGGKRMSI